jgi:DNA polymerase III subunit gamma/tau
MVCALSSRALIVDWSYPIIMSYLVLARKWRPGGFDDLIGQESILRLLKNSLEQGKIAHAYLFSGPRGVGKTSTARILAKALNCSNGPTSTPCGTCPFCTSITDGSSVDVMEIDGASNNSVNDIRDLRERVKYVPSGGRYKVYIIDETHMLSDAAFNALLKTLEEPPSHVVFVLATTAPKKIPSTVLSRCQHLPFRRIPTYQIKERLQKISDAEGITISVQALEMVARAADGSLRDSLTILDQISSFSSDISEADVKDLLGITDFGLISQLARAIIRGEREDILKITGELVERGTDIRSFTRELIQFFRDLLVAGIIKDPGKALDIGKEECEFMKDILSVTTEDHLTLILSELLAAEIDIRNASSPRLAFEISLLKTSFLKGMRPVKEIIENIETYMDRDRKSPHEMCSDKNKSMEKEGVRPIAPRLENASDEESDRDVVEEAPDAVRPDAPVIQTHEDLPKKELSLTDEIWENSLKKMEPPLASKLANAEFKLSGDKVVLTLNGGLSLFADSIKKNLATIEQIFSEQIGGKVTVEVETVKKKSVRKKDLKTEVLSDPAVKEVIDLFDGRVVDVTSTTESGKENL